VGDELRCDVRPSGFAKYLSQPIEQLVAAKFADRALTVVPTRGRAAASTMLFPSFARRFARFRAIPIRPTTTTMIKVARFRATFLPLHCAAFANMKAKSQRKER
jgi:hypothetical protein